MKNARLHREQFYFSFLFFHKFLSSHSVIRFQQTKDRLCSENKENNIQNIRSTRRKWLNDGNYITLNRKFSSFTVFLLLCFVREVTFSRRRRQKKRNNDDEEKTRSNRHERFFFRVIKTIAERNDHVAFGIFIHWISFVDCAEFIECSRHFFFLESFIFLLLLLLHHRRIIAVFDVSLLIFIFFFCTVESIAMWSMQDWNWKSIWLELHIAPNRVVHICRATHTHMSSSRSR